MTDYLHALPPGYRIEEYELVRVLGSGGFGITYLGYDHHLDKAVAIKEYLPNDLAVRADNNSVLPKSTQDKADYEWGLARFLNEAQTLARFDHRHIIKIHRFFRAHGTGYSVMEYAEGETLSELLQRKGTLTEAELKRILLPILDGLEAVHEADFLHRDIKPSNIVIRDDGSPVLIDFGSARQAVAGKSRSVTAIVTPGYAPIEQYSAKGHQGPWTDIYGLGAVCYRCLTGEPPVDATERLRADPLVPATKRCEGQASTALLGAIDRALGVDEGERPQTIAAWRQVLVEGGKSVRKAVTRSAESSVTASIGMSWSSRALVAVIVALLVASAWQGWNLYRAASGDGTGETVVVEQQAETASGIEGDRQTETQMDSIEIEADLSASDETLNDFKRGVDAYSREDYLEAVKWYRRAAEQGHAQAQFELGLMYASGKGVTKDVAEGVRWIRKAAEQGDAKSQLVLGALYHTGMGDVAQNDAEAVRWYRMAAEQGNAKAQYFLGGMYASGGGVTKDDAEAAKWYRKAANQGHAGAQYDLGLLYANGKGVLQDYVAAMRWYRMAAEQGNAKAQYGLGWMYANGEGVLLDYVSAYMWFNIATSIATDDWAFKTREARDNAAAYMGASDILEAQQRARICRESNYQQCD